MKIRNRMLSGAIAVLVAFGAIGIPTSASPVKQIPSTELESVYNTAVDSDGWENWPNGPQIYSEAGIVMDVESGAILYAKNMDDPHYPASITKILTALVGLENNELDEPVEFTQECWDDMRSDYAHIGMDPGVIVTMEEALYGLMLESANEVAYGIGANTEGGYDNFISLMNQKAQELGCKNSNFVNTNGIHNDEHYTSARDMALISAAAFKNEDFRKITGTLNYNIQPNETTDVTRYCWNHHKMLKPKSGYFYEYCVGGKTGYTDKALTTLVTFATKDDKTLVSVVMRTHGGGANAYADTKAMLEYGFENFSKVSVTKEQIADEHIASVVGDGYVMLPNGITFEQLHASFVTPTEVGDKVGTVTYTYNEQPVGSLKVQITDEYYNQIHGVEEKKQQSHNEQGEIPTVIKVLLWIVCFIFIIFVGLFVLALYMKAVRRRKKRMSQMRRRQE